MKKSIFLLFLCIFSLPAIIHAQTTNSASTDKPEIIRDRLMVDVFHTFWMGTPKEVNVNKFHPGFNVTGMWDFKSGNKGPFSFGLGVGVSYYTQFSDALLKWDSKDNKMRYYVIPYDTIFSLNRMNYVNVHIPLEFRYRHKNGFKVSLGVRLGLVAEISQKYKGLNPNGNGERVRRKSFEIYNKQKYNFDVYLRMGWKYVSVYYCYQITPLFTKGDGPQIMPMSLGVTWNIF